MGLAWYQAPHLGKKEKQSASEVNREVVTARLASLADIFPTGPRFLPFSHTAEPGPRPGWGEEE